jgi:hypothetical protein
MYSRPTSSRSGCGLGKDKSKSRDVSYISIASGTPDPFQEGSSAGEPKRRRLSSKRPVIKKESPTVMYVPWFLTQFHIWRLEPDLLLT